MQNDEKNGEAPATLAAVLNDMYKPHGVSFRQPIGAQVKESILKEIMENESLIAKFAPLIEAERENIDTESILPMVRETEDKIKDFLEKKHPNISHTYSSYFFAIILDKLVNTKK